MLLPKNDTYIYIGSNLTLTCNLTKFDPGPFDSRYLYFSRHNDTVIPSEFVRVESNRAIVLRFPIHSNHDAGMYMCKRNRTGHPGEIIGDPKFILVERK